MKKNAQKDRIAHDFDAYSFLHERVAAQAEDRLQEWGPCAHLLDWGCHTGALSTAISNGSLRPNIDARDNSPRMVLAAQAKGINAQICSPAMPLPDDRFDRIVSLMSLHWVNDLPQQLRLFRNALTKGGYVLAAIPGGGSLARLRTCLMEAETLLTGGAAPRLSPLPALKDCGRLLQLTGFTDIMVDRTEILLRYSNLRDGLADLRHTGEQAAFAQSAARNLSPRILALTESLYKEKFADSEGRLPANIEILWLTARRPA